MELTGRGSFPCRPDWTGAARREEIRDVLPTGAANRGKYYWYLAIMYSVLIFELQYCAVMVDADNDQ